MGLHVISYLIILNHHVKNFKVLNLKIIIVLRATFMCTVYTVKKISPQRISLKPRKPNLHFHLRIVL